MKKIFKLEMKSSLKIKRETNNNSNEIAHEFGVFSIDNGPNPFYSYKIRAPGFCLFTTT